MGVLEDDAARKYPDRKRATDARILEIEKKAAKKLRLYHTLGFDIKVFHKDVRLNCYGFYNSAKLFSKYKLFDPNIYLPQSALTLGYDELYAVILSEAMLAFIHIRSVRTHGCILILSFIVLLVFLSRFSMHILLSALISWAGAYLIATIFTGNPDKFSNKYIHIDNNVIKLTKNRQALINALNFMNDNEQYAYKTTSPAINERIKKLADYYEKSDFKMSY